VDGERDPEQHKAWDFNYLAFEMEADGEIFNLAISDAGGI
jgi:hypothetical protein